MRIHEAGGELGLIERIRATYAGAAGDGLSIPIGDDAAVLDIPVGRQAVVTTDMLVENIHFRRDWSDPYSIGWKAAAVNLSDIAAMGAEPTFAFISLAFPPGEMVETLDRIYDGFSDCLTRYGARLAGGDTNASPETLVINVTLMGTVAAGKAWTRHAALPGDALLVTGSLGESAGGLALLTEYGYVRAVQISPALVNAHRRPQPRLMAARAAARIPAIRAAMDISDGLLEDLQKLCAASGVGAQVNAADIPISDALRAAAELLGQDALEMAIAGGEDYELLLVVPPGDAETVRTAIVKAGTPCAIVGEIARTGLSLVALDGKGEMPVAVSGWDHFRT